jgi:hypothetical protein
MPSVHCDSKKKITIAQVDVEWAEAEKGYWNRMPAL